MSRAIKALPSTDTCNVCGKDLRHESVYYDANLRASAFGRMTWAWVCQTCFKKHGIGIGTGLAQEYDSETDMKVRG